MGTMVLSLQGLYLPYQTQPPPHSHVSMPRPSHCWFSYSSQYGGRHGPAQSQQSSSHRPQSPVHFGQPGPGGCTKKRAGDLGISGHVSGSCAHHFTVSPGARVIRPRKDEKWNGQRPGLNPQHQRKGKEEAHTCTMASFASPLG